jgi:hypothetical protein
LRPPAGAPPAPSPAESGAGPRAAPPADPRAVPAAPFVAKRSETRPVPLPAPRSPGAEDVFRVDGRSISKSDLGDFVLRYLPDRAQDALSQLVDEALIEAEAARETMPVAERDVEERTAAYVEERRKDARIQYGPSTDLETLMKERYGRDLASLRADAARLVRTLILRDRLVRLDELREDGVEIRVLVLASRTDAEDAVRSLRDGADMTLYAERAGLRRPAAPAPASRGEIPEKELEAKLFAASAGDVLDPVPFDAPGKGTFWQVFKVVRAWKATAAPWDAVSAPVLASLAATPVTEDEYRRWQRRALARHKVEVLDAGKGFVRTGAGQ